MPRMASSLAVVGAMALVAVADGLVRAQPLPMPDLPAIDRSRAASDGTLARQIEREPRCRERSNGCEVCVRGEAGHLSCSLPGIACQPGGWRCTLGEEQSSSPSPRN